MSSRLPAYPLVTIDPFFSIWSTDERLNNTDTTLWTGHKKALYGYVYVDGEKYGFMGNIRKKITQMRLSVDFLNTVYEFENDAIRLSVDFWGTHFLDDLDLLSTPVGFIDYCVASKDGRKHEVKVEISMNVDFTYDKIRKPITFKNGYYCGKEIIGMGQTAQNPLAYSGDNVSADWGYYYLFGSKAEIDKKLLVVNGIKVSEQFFLTEKEAYKGRFLIGYDDGEAIEYFGDRLKGYWTKTNTNIEQAFERYCLEGDKLLLKRNQWNEKLAKDVEKNYGEAYLKVLRAAYRQVLAAHKLVEDKNGNLLYLSKECHSNGCINTVDVSYPSIPLFLLYSPELVLGMMNGIFRFSGSKVWTFDFAPHDIGRYPIANGQIYAYNKRSQIYRKYNHARIFEMDSSVYNFNSQMPVEECGNMLIMSYAYLYFGGRKEELSDRLEALQKWADYLVSVGVILDNQLCTDDFAGHSEKNVNLAIKGVTGIACFAMIAKALGMNTGAKDYYAIACDYARQLVNLAKKDDYLVFAIGKTDSWSQKYNLVWDVIFDLKLFDKSLLIGESKQYDANMLRYGVPLDSRSSILKTDWFMWVSIFDNKTDLYAEKLVDFLEKTQDRRPFSDYINAISAERKSFDHRSVQGGLWLPVLLKK